MPKNRLVLIIFPLALAVIFFGVRNASAPTSPSVSLGNTTITVEIADTQDEQTLGLSGRDSLSDGHGMLFVFEKSDYWVFWMKDMKFPIDIIWLAPSEVEGIFKIVDVKENALPESYPQNAFAPEKKARYVLEVPAGFFEEHNLRLGDSVTITWRPGRQEATRSPD